MKNKLSAMVAQARGGRVMRTAFINSEEIDRRLLRDDEVGHKIAGGFPDAKLVILTLYPSYIPDVDSGIGVYRITLASSSPTWDTQDIAVQLKLLGLPEDSLGDIREERNGSFLIAANTKSGSQIVALDELSGRSIKVEEIGESAGKAKLREVVVPSMRVDVVGAKGFGISRAYFQQGIDSGKVRLNGQIARSSSEIREGDSLSADGLGRIDFKKVLNETRRGNFKVELDVHR